MASPSESIISPRFCAPHTINLEFVGEDGNFEVKEINNGSIYFKVEAAYFTFHDRRFLLDPTGTAIVRFQHQITSLHDRWQVFRGDSIDPSDLIFSAKLSSIFQLTATFDVFLASNTEENVCDFKIKCDSSERCCVIYAGESSTIVGQMQMRTTGSFLKRRDSYMVTIHPNIDQAFIVALIVILDKSNTSSYIRKAWDLAVSIWL